MANRRVSIRRRCIDCSAGSWAEVDRCGHPECALHPYRTGRGKQDPKARNKAIRAYCLWCCCNQPKEVRLCPSNTCSLYLFRGSKQEHPVVCPETSPAAYFSTSDAKGGMMLYPQETHYNDYAPE